MGLEATWSLVDIPADARDAAQAAAHREGVSVGEWLTRRILRRFSELNAREHEETFVALRKHVAELSARLERFEGQSHAEPMREALKKLHQGLGRLNDELVRTAGHSAIQVSQLSTSLDALGGQVKEIRQHDTERRSTFERRMSQLQEFVDGMNLRQAAETRTLASRIDSFGTTLAESRRLIANDGHAVERLEESLAKSETRYSGALRTIQERLDSFSDSIGHVAAGASESSAALEQRIASLQLELTKSDDQHAEEGRLTSDRLHKLHSKLDDWQADVTGMCGALDRRILLGQQALQSLDARHAEMSHSLTRGVESVAAQMDAARSESARIAATLESRIATLESAAGSAAGTNAATDGRFRAIEQGLSDLENRTTATESQVSAALPGTEAVTARLEQLNLRLEDEIGRQQQAVEQLKTALIEQTLNALGEKLETEGKKQQAAIAALQGDLLGQLSQAFDERTEAEERKQRDAMAALQSNFATALQSLSETFECQARKHQEAIAELRASLVTVPHTTTAQSSETSVADVQMPIAQAVSGETDERHAIDTQRNESVVSDSVAPVSEQHDEHVLELTAFADQAPAIAEHNHPVQQTVSEPPPFDGTEDAQPDAELPAHGDLEPFAPAIAMAHASTADSPLAGASYLSAARQSLQAAATGNEPEGTRKDLFGARLLGSLPLIAKPKGQATSYALIAGIVLVAVLAIGVGIIELTGHKEPSSFARPNPARAAKTMSSGIMRSAGKTHARPAASSGTDQFAVLASGGNAQAQLLVGLRALAKNDTGTAAKWLERAALQGVPVAQYRLATLYASGRGVAADKGKAFRWYLAAAQAGNRKAMSNLAVAYAQGDGTPKNPQEAGRWFLKAAQLGLADAQFDLAILYERGLGVPQNLTDAYRWYVIAAKAGDRESKDRVDALSSQLTAEDRAAAETAAAEFKPQPTDMRANEPQ